MLIGVPKEAKAGEQRVAISPDGVKELIKNGFSIVLETGAGNSSFFSDEAYKAQGANIASKEQVYKDSDILLAINPPPSEDIAKMKKGATLISFMYAATRPELVEACVNAGINAFSMDAVPRISRAQKMDALSSQANLAGYKAVLLAAVTLGKIFPMMTTAAGTIRPSKVMIFGAGVAGLQAIATAKRLGAIVEVTDIRPETKEQVESLGGKFINTAGDDASIKIEGGYVKGVSEDFLAKQQAIVSKHVAEADIVITTALIPGRKAPVLVTDEMIKSMRAGSVIVDMAVEQGGNVVGSVLNQNTIINGVTIIGEGNLPSLLPMNASELYSKNILAFLFHLATKDALKWEMEEEITIGSLIVKDGVAVHPTVTKTVNA